MMKRSQGMILLFLLVLVVTLPILFPISRWESEGFQAPLRGRYIHLQHSQGKCINLAEIRAYGYKGGPNLVTPQTAITKSSNPSDPSVGKNEFATDRNEDTFIHTACNGKDIPWVRVDLGVSQPLYKIHILNRKDCCINRTNGLVLTILDEKQKGVYVAEPIKDKKGRTTYVDTKPEYSNQTDYYRAFTWYPPKPTPIYDALDEDDLPSNLRCRNQNTAFDLDGSGNLIFLDRQQVFCGPDEVMRGFQLARQPSTFPGKVRYNYQCCKVSAPLPPTPSFLTEGPGKFSKLETDVQAIQKQLRQPPPPPTPLSLPSEITRTPDKVAILEKDVKQIRQQMEKQATYSPGTALDTLNMIKSQSAPPPLRNDIIPENRLTEIGATAMSLGNQSSFLRDIRRIIQNEIRADRAVDPLLPAIQ